MPHDFKRKIVAKKFVLHQLTDEQEREPNYNHIRMLMRILKFVITGDKTWIFGYNVETKTCTSEQLLQAFFFFLSN